MKSLKVLGSCTSMKKGSDFYVKVLKNKFYNFCLNNVNIQYLPLNSFKFFDWSRYGEIVMRNCLSLLFGLLLAIENLISRFVFASKETS